MRGLCLGIGLIRLLGGTAAPASLVPVNTVLPAITGTATQGQVLTASTGTWTNSPTGYTYQWNRSGSAISGATSSTYTLQAADVGATVTVTVTATNAVGSTAATSAATATIGASGGSYPASVNSATWSATAKTVYDLSSTANTGYRTAPTKVVGTDALPANASFVAGDLTLGAGGGVFSGWTVGDYQVDVTGSGWTIQDNLFNGDGTGDIYALNISASNTTVCYNSFDGNYGQNIHTAFAVQGAAANVAIYRNRFVGIKSDTGKVFTTITDSTRPHIYENYFEIGGWANTTGVHYDCITAALGGTLIEHNLLDLTPYTNPANRADNALDTTTPINTPPAGAPAGYYTWGLTSVLRMQDDTAGGTMTNVSFNQNIARGFKRGGFYPFTIVDNQIEGAFTFTDNILEEGVHNGMFHPVMPADAGYTMAFTGNTRYSDGAAFNNVTTNADITGATSVAPSPPVLAYIDNVTDTGFTIFFDRGGDTGANGGHNYALSTDGGTTWGSWTATTGAVTGLSAGTTYKVKMQATNGNGTSADSNVLTQLTTGTAVTLSGTNYTFDTDRTDLSLEPGWTRHYGTSGAIATSGGIVTKGASASADNFYREGVLVSSGSQRSGFTFNVSGTTTNRLAVMGSGTQGAFTGYVLYPSSATGVRATAFYSDGTSATLGTTTVTSALAAFQLEVILGSPNTVKVYDGAGALLATYTDSNALRATSGYNGLKTATTAAIANTGDNFIGNIH